MINYLQTKEIILCKKFENDLRIIHLKSAKKIIAIKPPISQKKKDKNIFINIGSFFFGVVIKSINERKKVPLVTKIKAKIIVKLLMLFILGTILL